MRLLHPHEPSRRAFQDPVVVVAAVVAVAVVAVVVVVAVVAGEGPGSHAQTTRSRPPCLA